MYYHHKQTGHLMRFIIFALIIYFSIISIISGYNSIVILTMVVILLLLLSFLSLTITIDTGYLRLKFGYGIFKKKFKLKDISSVKAVKHKWYHGWGIKIWFWPYMKIYNISGFDMIEFKAKNRIYRIGTDDVKNLEYALKRAIK